MSDEPTKCGDREGWVSCANDVGRERGEREVTQIMTERREVVLYL